jgi:hypothetical protein
VIRDLTSQGDLIAELHLESLFNSGATHAEPEVHFPREREDAVRLCHRLALINKLAIDAQGLSFKKDQGMGSIESGRSAALRAAAIGGLCGRDDQRRMALVNLATRGFRGTTALFRT